MTTVTTQARAATEAAEPGVADLHRRACESTRKFIAGIQPGQWRNACTSEGTVSGLVNHLVNGQLWTAELLHGKDGADPNPDLEGDLLGRDPLAAYDAACAAAQVALEEPGALERVCRTGHGDMPAAFHARIRIMDVFVHGWDLAQATGQDPTLDSELVEVVYRDWKPQEAMLRGSGMFGPAPDVPADANTQTRMLALFGRPAAPAAPIRVRELGHAGMYVKDLEASVRFYHDFLGFEISGRLPGTVFVTSGRTHHEFALIEPGPECVPGPKQPAFGVNHIAVRVGESIDDLRNAHRRLVETGTPILGIIDFVIQNSILIEDPDGTMVELYIDTDVPWRTDPKIFERALPKALQL
ncbi:MAG: TIGR03086 family protein [Chloroflexi bacterium]|nr:TIGR03086 family protein [Chloroflexota bacterium]MBV9597470.1 TIGR03086 family protein [Chloroflexota bacterium]